MADVTLVPLDGSVFAEQALLPAQSLARRVGSTLHLVRVEAAAGDLLEEAPGYLERVAASLQANGFTVSYTVCEGAAAPEILTELRVTCADYMVMATHGRTGLGRWLYGSTADSLLRQVTLPVLLVPAQCHASSWPQDRPLRVVVPLDGSQVAETILPTLVSLAQAGPTEVILVQVLDKPGYGLYAEPAVLFPFDTRAQYEEAQGYLEKAAERLRDADAVVSTRVGAGSVAPVISDVAWHEEAQLILLATHGRGGLTRAVLGSVALDTLRRSTVPLLVQRAAVTSHSVGAQPEEAVAQRA